MTSPSYCGFDCTKCPVRIATMAGGADPDGKRCTGCQEPGPKFPYCAECSIRLSHTPH